MSFYRTEKNRPKSDKVKPLSDRVQRSIAPIITEEFNSGATSEEILGAIIQTVVAEVSDQTIGRTLAEKARGGRL